MSEKDKGTDQQAPAPAVSLSVEQLTALLAQATGKASPRKYKEKEGPRNTPGNKVATYKMQESETSLVHVELQQKQFNTETGEAMFKPFVQIFEPRTEWPQFLENRNGLNIKKVLHLPQGAMTVEAFDMKKEESK